MPLSSTKVGWDDYLVFPRSHGLPSHHAPIRTPAPGMRAIALPVGSSANRLRGGRWDHFVGRSILHLDSCGWDSVHELSVPDPRLSNHPPHMGKKSFQLYHTFFKVIEALDRPLPLPPTDLPQRQVITITECQWSLRTGTHIIHPGLRLYCLDFGDAFVRDHSRCRP